MYVGQIYENYMATLCYFSAVKVIHKFGQNLCWPAFWAIISQTHLVNLGKTDEKA
jgi:hypothetical protein